MSPSLQVTALFMQDPSTIADVVGAEIVVVTLRV